MGCSDFSMVKGKTLQCRTESQGFRLNESVAELSLPRPRMSPLLSSRALARGWTQEDLLALPAGRSMKHPHPGPGGSPPASRCLPWLSKGAPGVPGAPNLTASQPAPKRAPKTWVRQKERKLFLCPKRVFFFLSLALLILPFTPCRF